MKKHTPKTVLRYAGGKSRAIKKITPFVEPYSEIVSPFLGGGSLEVHWASKGKKVIASDVFDILANFWNSLLSDPDALADELQKISPDKETYKEIKEALICTPEVQNMLKDWTTDFYKYRTFNKLDDKGNPIIGDNEKPEKIKELRTIKAIDDVKLAAYYYFNHNCSYGPGFLGWASSIYMDQKKWNNAIKRIRAFHAPNVEVHNESFETFMPKYKEKFMYLDPPYYLDKDKDNKMLGGIYPMKNIPVHHDKFDHENLRDLLLAHEGDFVLSYNNCETIREWYKEFELFYPEWYYSMDVGETRVGKNRKGRVNDEDLKEVDRLTKQIESLEIQLKELEEHLETLQEKLDTDVKEPEKHRLLAPHMAKIFELRQPIADLKTQRHEIMKKESHEILIVKR